jgi:sodium transport system permease protein
MRLQQTLIIFRKELVETLRDRRTLLMMIGLPALLYPLGTLGIARFVESQNASARARNPVVALWGTAPTEFVDALRAADPRLELEPWLDAPAEVRRSLETNDATPPASDAPERPTPILTAARGVIDSGRADAVLVLWPGLERALAHDELAAVSLYFDSVREDSRTARGRLVDALSHYRASLLTRREASHRLPAGFTEALDLKRVDVAPPARRSGNLVGSVLPLILLTLALLGGLYSAIDMTAGEKERGTLQTLMVAPLHSSEIVMGKFLAVWVVSLVAAAANIASLSLTLVRLVPAGLGSLAAGPIALTALMLVPVTMATSALFLAIAVFAKDFKDGQNFLTPVYMALLGPAGLAALPSMELGWSTAFVPIVNVALLVKALSIGAVSADLVLLVLLSTVLYAVLAIALATNVFAREQIMLGGRESARNVLGLGRRAGGVPSPLVALCAFAVCLTLAFYASVLLEKRGVVTNLVVTQYGFVLLPALGVVFGLGYSARDTLLLRLPSLRHVVAAVLVGASSSLAISGVVLRLVPMPESVTKTLEHLMKLGDPPMPLWAALLGIAVTPALCEELFFRGVVLSGLRRLGAGPALAVSALLFGLAHVSVHRLLPTLALGVMLGWLALRSGSIVPSMVVHLMNNALVVWLARHPSAADRLGPGEPPPLSVTGVAVVMCAAGLWLAWKTPGRAPRDGGSASGASPAATSDSA